MDRHARASGRISLTVKRALVACDLLLLWGEKPISVNMRTPAAIRPTKRMSGSRLLNRDSDAIGTTLRPSWRTRGAPSRHQ